MERVLAIDGRAANAEQRAGIGNFCSELLRELPCAAAKAGWRIRIYLDAMPRLNFPVDANQADFSVADFRILPVCRLWTHRRLGPALRRERPDVFYAPGLQIPLFTPCPTIATIYDLAIMRYPNEFTLKRRFLAQLELRHARQACSAFVVISQATQIDAMNMLGVPAEKITLALPGCNPRFRPCFDEARKDSLRKQLGLNRPYLLYVGRIQPRKNLVLLMEAFNQICAKYPDWPYELVLTGAPGWMDKPIRDCAKHLACADRIRFTGFVPDEDLPVLMSGAEIFILVSLWEGFGMPLVEAMACGTPTITSNTSALAEVAENAALQVDPEDKEAIAGAIEQLLTEPLLRAKLVQHGLDRATQFNWATTAQNVILAADKTSNEIRLK